MEIIAIAAVVILFLSIARYVSSKRRQPNDAVLSAPRQSRQLEVVAAATYSKKQIMSKKEYRVFRVAELLVKAANNGYRVFAQTSLGEVISSNDSKAFSAINSKRIDILIIDGIGNPVAAIEYQGSGHYQGTAVIRDAVKREALRKAGVVYIEIQDGDGDERIKQKILLGLGWTEASLIGQQQTGLTLPISPMDSASAGLPSSS